MQVIPASSPAWGQGREAGRGAPGGRPRGQLAGKGVGWVRRFWCQSGNHHAHPRLGLGARGFGSFHPAAIALGGVGLNLCSACGCDQGPYAQCGIRAVLVLHGFSLRSRDLGWLFHAPGVHHRKVFGLTSEKPLRALPTDHSFPEDKLPVHEVGFVLAYRCGAVPESHRIPFHDGDDDLAPSLGAVNTISVHRGGGAAERRVMTKHNGAVPALGSTQAFA